MTKTPAELAAMPGRFHPTAHTPVPGNTPVAPKPAGRPAVVAVSHPKAAAPAPVAAPAKKAAAAPAASAAPTHVSVPVATLQAIHDTLSAHTAALAALLPGTAEDKLAAATVARLAGQATK